MKIVKASYDKVWGTGIPIHSDECLNEDKWHGFGILGEILMEIREETHAVPPSMLTTTPMDTAVPLTTSAEDVSTINSVGDVS